MPYCSQCGENNPDGARFCQKCGASLSAATPGGATGGPSGDPAKGPSAGPGGTHPGPGAPPPPPPGGGYGYQQQQPGWQSAPVANQKSVVGATLLGVFLWGLGIHCFYLGQTKKGIALLVGNIALWVTQIYVVAPFLGFVGCAVFGYDAYKLATRINSGERLGEWQFF